jgi:hypothetical protein
VASATSSLPEVTGDAALGVNPRSVREIAAAIASLVGDRPAERLAEAGAAGRTLLVDETAG